MILAACLHAPPYRGCRVRRARRLMIWHEPFTPVWRKCVNGYDFIGAHWTAGACRGKDENAVAGVEEFFAANAGSFDPARPFSPETRSAALGAPEFPAPARAVASVETIAARNEIVVYQPNEAMRLEVRLENETVWLTQGQLCELFGVVKSNVSYHLKNVFSTGELDYEATVQKIRTVRVEAGRRVFTLIPDFS